MTNKPKLNQPDVEPTTTLPNITIEKEKNLELIKQLGIELTSLTPQPSKLEQCIKEWEERGYEWKIDKENKSVIILWNIQKLSRFEIDLKHKRVKCNHQIPNLIIYDIDRSFAYVDFEEVHLLSKTLKAMEEMKDDNI